MKTLLACLLTVAAALPANVDAAVATRATAPKTAPDFTLRGLDGHNLRLNEQRGNVVLVNFWATWCGPCKQEMPELNRLYDRYRASGFVLLGVNVDSDPAQAQAVATRLGLHFPVLLDADKTVSRLYELDSMPSTVLIDRDGRVRYLHRGYREGTAAAYEQQIRELVTE